MIEFSLATTVSKPLDNVNILLQLEEKDDERNLQEKDYMLSSLATRNYSNLMELKSKHNLTKE